MEPGLPHIQLMSLVVADKKENILHITKNILQQFC